MAKKSKLLTALDAHKCRNIKLEKQRKLEKQAAKRKQARAQGEVDEEENLGLEANGARNESGDEFDDWETGQSEINEISIPLDGESDSASSVGEEEEEQKNDDNAMSKDPPNGSTIVATSRSTHGNAINKSTELEDDDASEDPEEDEEEDIPLSDLSSLASSDKADFLPHQRLTINNTTALLAAHNSITLSPKLPFSAHQTLLTATPVHIADINDDLTRELAFYKQCLDAANQGRELLQKEGVPFSRPGDYFAEMVKSDEHMGKVKQKMVDDAAGKKAAQEARRQRDLKRFGKQVQVAKEQERAKDKRRTLEKIDLLKRKRKNNDTGNTNEADMFDVALEDAAKEDRQSRSSRDRKGRDAGGPPHKRQKKDQKFGFGGKKRFSKSGDAVSTGDMSGYSAKKMKERKGGTKRLGKSRRAKA